MLNPYENDFSRSDLLATAAYLKSKGLSDAQTKDIIDMMQRGEVEMSQRDGVVMQKNEADAPGAYITADQLAQDAYANTPAAFAQAQGTPAGFFPTMGDMNQGFVPVTSPNARVETEGQRQTVRPDGTVVIY